MKVAKKTLTAAQVYKNETSIPQAVRFTKAKVKKTSKKASQKKKVKKVAAAALSTTKAVSPGINKKIKVQPKKTLANGTNSNGIKKTKKKKGANKGQSLIAYIAEKERQGDSFWAEDVKKKGSRQGLSGKPKREEKKRNKNLSKKILKVKQLIDKEGKKKLKEVAPTYNDDSEEMSEIDEEEDIFETDEEEDIFETDEDGEMVEVDENGDMVTYSLQTFSGDELDAVNTQDSRKQGQETFEWIISPITEEVFFSKHWEKEPLFVKRKDENYYKGLFSTHDFDKILQEQVVLFTKNLDVTSYKDGKRETHNPVGQAHGPVVWDYYNNGCSLRMLNPQTFHPYVWKTLTSLQEYFNSFCGANVYLTPPDTQGFAPHWDDIEAFVVQLEGKKRWRVYKPRSDNEVLPVVSSPNLSEDSIGKPIIDTVLESGDLLYFPRGYIHQANAVENEHSLHITLSTYQKNSWGQYLEKLLPHALSVAMSEDVEFRRGLPRNCLNYMGIVNMDVESKERTEFKEKVCSLVERMLSNASFDAAVDQLGAALMHDNLPPYLTPEDKVCSVYGGGERWSKKKAKVINRVELQPDTQVRLLRGNCMRLVAEEETIHIYHCLENSREYHKEEPQFIEISSENAPAIESLIHIYPAYVAIESLPLQDEEEKMNVVIALWERGLIVTAMPLDAQYDD